MNITQCHDTQPDGLETEAVKIEHAIRQCVDPEFNAVTLVDSDTSRTTKYTPDNHSTRDMTRGRAPVMCNQVSAHILTSAIKLFCI